MGGLLSINPWVWLGALAIVAASWGSGYIKGAAGVRQEVNLERAARIVKRDKDIRTINAKDGELSAAFEAGRAAKAAELKGMANELETMLETLKSATACVLPPGAVELLNRARRPAAVPAPAGEPDATLPRPRAVEGRADHNTREADAGRRGGVHHLRGSPEEAAGGSAAAATTRLTLQGMTP